MEALYPDLFGYIQVARNRRWVQRIEAMLAARAPGCVITGLYHLAGPDNVFDQLQSAGHTP